MVPKNRRTYLLFVDIVVHDLKYKAMAGLISSFLETVIQKSDKVYFMKSYKDIKCWMTKV